MASPKQMTSGHEEHEDLELVLMEEEQRVKQDDELVANEQQQAVEHEPTPAPTLPHAEAVEQEERRQVGDGGITMVVLAEECMNGGN